MELRNAVGILTGASRGIGVVLAEHLAGKGTHLALAARTEEGLVTTAERVRALGVRVVTIPTDVTSRAGLAALVARTEEELGPVDLLVNNAATEKYELYERIEPDVIEDTVRTNLLAPMHLTRLVVPGMVARGHGHVVNISSLAGKTAAPYNSAYSATKHALVGFSWSLREEMKDHGVGVSVICPGFISDTGMSYSWLRGRKLPRIAGIVSPEKVAREVIRAVEKNKSDLIVSGGLGRMADLFMAMSPDTTMRIIRRGGAYDLLRKAVDES